MRRRLFAIVFIFSLVGLALIALVAYADGGDPFDTDDSGYIEEDEARAMGRSYLEGRLSRDEAVDYLFHYFSHVPLPMTPGPTPTPTPTLTPTPTQTPVSSSGTDPIPMLEGCRSAGHVGSVEQKARHLEVSFYGPDPHGFGYGGLILWEFEDHKKIGNVDDAYYFRFTSSGEWKLYHPKWKSRYSIQAGKLLASGWLSDSGIPLYTKPEDRNRLTFFAATPSNGYRYSFYINGVKVPVEVHFTERNLEEYSEHRKYLLVTSYGTYWDNPCTVDAWSAG